MRQTLYLKILVFFTGLVTLGTELTSSRLLAPFFGTSMPVWSALIGLILLALSLGYFLGGRLADRSPNLSTLLYIILITGLSLVILPMISSPVLGASLAGLAHLNAGILAGTFVSVLLLLGMPMVLLGCVTPFAVRLATEDLKRAGTTAGGLFAWSTIGSFLGSLLPALVLVPAIGTRCTLALFGITLFAVSLPGFIIMKQKREIVITASLIVLSLIYSAYIFNKPVKPGQNVLFEGESIYQFVQVIKKKNGWTHLKLNEGMVSHSVYHPDKILSYREWDYFALAPFFNPSPCNPLKEMKSWALIGSGAGTTARLISYLYEDVSIKGIEIDPMVVEAGKKFFNMPKLNYEPIIQDGRAWITMDKGKYDVIGIDAYRQAYIPFELATVEFFKLVHERLNDPGLVCLNAPLPLGDRRIVNALASTMQQVFPSVHLFNLRKKSQTILIVGTNNPGSIEDFKVNTEGLSGPMLKLVRAAEPRIETFHGQGMVLTDDKAPVERLMDLAVISSMMKQARAAESDG